MMFATVMECATVLVICDAISNIYQQKGDSVRSEQGLAVGILFLRP